MIEAQHAVIIHTPIDSVWNYVQDISRWALLFPGCRECEVIDEHKSKWIIKVGAGGLVKTVNVHVNVDRWAGPERVEFSYALETEPVTGSGSYVAASQGDGATEILMYLRVEGTGQTAPMWEAVSRPLLPQMAKSFAGKLKEEIERAAGISPRPEPSLFARLRRWLGTLWRQLIGRAS
jgi:carbon monoxide dehydrogenase subunit G